jgi:hypothetical protein
MSGICRSDLEILSKMTIEDYADEIGWSADTLIEVLEYIRRRTGLGESKGKPFRWQLLGDVIWKWMLFGEQVLDVLPNRICKDDPGMYELLSNAADLMGRSVPLTRFMIHGEHAIPEWAKK